jgi:hypothetical protein
MPNKEKVARGKLAGFELSKRSSQSYEEALKGGGGDGAQETGRDGHRSHARAASKVQPIDEALFTTVAMCAMFNMMNRLVEGCGIEGFPEQHAAAAHMLATKGYKD